MKKRLLPLLGIAFVVAVIATGIFYGLIVGKLRSARSRPQNNLVVAARNLDPGTVIEKADLKLTSWSGSTVPQGAFSRLDEAVGLTVVQPIGETEPVTYSRLASRDDREGVARTIPAGMRAVSIHVPDSPGILHMLRPGNKVDVQVVRNRQGARSGEVEIRTLLEAVQVLAVPEPAQGRAGGVPVVTLLAKPDESEKLSLADAGARIRLALRNPLDDEKNPAPARELASLFSERAVSRPARAAAARPRAVAAKRAVVPAGDPDVRFHVRVAEAGCAALEELKSNLLAPSDASGPRVAAFQPGWDLDTAVQKLHSRGLLEIHTASYLLTGDNRSVGLQSCGLSIQLQPFVETGSRMRVRVQPDGAASELDLLDAQSFLVSGFGETACASGRDRELVVLVTPRLSRPSLEQPRTAALTARP